MGERHAIGSAAASKRSALVPRPPPDLQDKVRRGLWAAFRIVLFRLSPVPFHGWRRLLLRMWGAQVADGAAIYPSVRIWAPWNVTIGRRATIGGGAELYSVAEIVIEDDAVVSQRAFLCSATHDHNSPRFTLMTAPITVGRNSWIAAEAFVGPGVTVAEDAVVGARSVVIRDVPAAAIVAGNPARRVGTRSPDGRNLLHMAGAGQPDTRRP